MSLASQITSLADLALLRGQPELFKRLMRVASSVEKKKNSPKGKSTREDYFDTDSALNKTIEDEREDEPPLEKVKEVDDPDGFGDSGEEAETDDDKTGDYSAFPVGALPLKQLRHGPQPWGVSNKPKWWKK